MSAYHILMQYGDKEEWNMDTMLDLLCTYIDNQGDNDTFDEFLEEQTFDAFVRDVGWDQEEDA